MVSRNPSFEFSPDGIGHVLSDRRLKVPVYQRSFSWEADQRAEYWDDLKAAFEQNQTEYFLGTIVLSKENSEGTFKYTIIDGQQRLATTSILLTAIRDHYKRQGDEPRARNLDQRYLSTFDPREGSDKPRLKLNSIDDAHYQALVDSRDLEHLTTIRHSHQLLKDTYDFFLGKVESEIQGAGEQWVTRLVDWVEFLDSHVRVVIVDVPTDSDAYLIFETLNDRGADLTIADLLKNYLFGRAQEDLDLVRDAWTAALGALEMSADSTIFVTFVRHLWSSMHGSTRERDLYKAIKSRVTSREHVRDFSLKLREAAQSYAALLNSDHETWSSVGSEGRANIETLMRLRLEQTRPLLLALMDYFSDSEFRVCLRSLVSWGVRGLIVGGIGGGKTERAYCDAAVAIRKGQVKTTAELLDAIASVVPSDEAFRTDFELARVSSSKLARYYLHALERTHRKDPERPELIPNEDEEQVNLEHVLPRNPDEGTWTEFNDDEQKLYYDRLGNMALLSKADNERIGNSDWDVKKTVLVESEIELTREMSEVEKWSPEAVFDRQKRLAEIALITWPRDPR